MTYKINSKGEPVRLITVGDSDGPSFKAYAPLSEAEKRELLVTKSIDMSGMPKIPFKLALIVRWYFMKIRDRHKTESFVFIHLDRDKGKYTAVVPGGYCASSASVDYTSTCSKFCSNCHIALVDGTWVDEEGKGACPYCSAEDSLRALNIAGSIHSHVDMAPFHSSTDNHNELTDTGLHFTLGYMDTGLFGAELSAVVAASGRTDSKGKGTRFALCDADIFELPFSESDLNRVNFWLSRVAVDKYFTSQGASDDSLHVVVVSGYPCFMGTKEECEAFEAKCALTCTVKKAKNFKTTTVGRYGGSYSGWEDFDWADARVGRHHNNAGKSKSSKVSQTAPASKKGKGTGKKSSSSSRQMSVKTPAFLFNVYANQESGSISSIALYRQSNQASATYTTPKSFQKIPTNSASGRLQGGEGIKTVFTARSAAAAQALADALLGEITLYTETVEHVFDQLVQESWVALADGLDQLSTELTDQLDGVLDDASIKFDDNDFNSITCGVEKNFDEDLGMFSNARDYVAPVLFGPWLAVRLGLSLQSKKLTDLAVVCFLRVGRGIESGDMLELATEPITIQT